MHMLWRAALATTHGGWVGLLFDLVLEAHVLIFDGQTLFVEILVFEKAAQGLGTSVTTLNMKLKMFGVVFLALCPFFHCYEWFDVMHQTLGKFAQYIWGYVAEYLRRLCHGCVVIARARRTPLGR